MRLLNRGFVLTVLVLGALAVAACGTDSTGPTFRCEPLTWEWQYSHNLGDGQVLYATGCNDPAEHDSIMRACFAGNCAVDTLRYE